MATLLRDILGAHDFPSLERRYLDATPWRNSDHGEHARPAGANRKKYVSIRPIEAKGARGYACRYHQTDVVTWLMATDRADPVQEIITVRAYSSLSTNVFADEFTPNNLRFDFAHDDGYFVYVGGAWGDGQGYTQRVYEFKSNTMTFTRNDAGFFQPAHEDVRPYEFIDARSPLMRVALKSTNYYAFMKWLNAVAAFDQKPHTIINAMHDSAMCDAINEADEMMCEHAPLGLLADASKWIYLWRTSAYAVDFDDRSVVNRREHILQKLREAIYRRESLPPRHEMEYATPEQHASQRKLRSIWY